MQIDEDISDLVIEEATKLGLRVVKINQRYEEVDDLVTVLYLGSEAPTETIARLEEAVESLGSQVIVVKSSS